MCLERSKRDAWILRLGFGAYALTGLLRLFLHPTSTFRTNVLDGASGLGVGVLLGVLLLTARRRREPRH
ncbi:MAG TPA: hypothetical protein VGS03_08715 [Candidatus Polarisedimenticolia bacterium]|jgi:hypothetical protein|nr:hypothetical protein [Candidatus Polarisedimenticolia bacterium]